jgi:N-acyl-D-amino-acid deacylase
MTISRRSFLATGGSALAVLAGAPALLLRPRGVPAASFVIRNGTVFDGLGNPGVEADVAITDGQVSAIGRALRDRGAQEIDARGLAVAPGFLDIHSHGDGSLW